MKIHKNDQVLIIKGKDRGKKGKVLEVSPKAERLVIEGLNLRKKHQKPKRGGEKGQVIETPAAMAVANVKLICPKCGQPTRVGSKIVEKKKYRLCKKCGSEF